jgi:hypothetical protein
MSVSTETIDRYLERRGAHPEWASAYGDPGYSSQFYVTFSIWKRPAD